MIYTENGILDGGHCIEVTPVADSSLRSENIMRRVRAHVPTNRMSNFRACMTEIAYKRVPGASKTASKMHRSSLVRSR